MTGFASSFHILRKRHEIVRYLVCSVWRIYSCQLAASGLQKLHQSSERLKQFKVIIKVLVELLSYNLFSNHFCFLRRCVAEALVKNREVQMCDEKFFPLELLLGALRCLRRATANQYVMISYACVMKSCEKRENDVVCSVLYIYILTVHNFIGPKGVMFQLWNTLKTD